MQITIKKSQNALAKLNFNFTGHVYEDNDVREREMTVTRR